MAATMHVTDVLVIVVGNSMRTRNLRCMHDTPKDVLTDAYHFDGRPSANRFAAGEIMAGMLRDAGSAPCRQTLDA